MVITASYVKYKKKHSIREKNIKMKHKLIRKIELNVSE